MRRLNVVIGLVIAFTVSYGVQSYVPVGGTEIVSVSRVVRTSERRKAVKEIRLQEKGIVPSRRREGKSFDIPYGKDLTSPGSNPPRASP